MGAHKENTIHLGFDTKKLKLIGQGHQGRVYLLPGNKVIKLYYKSGSCKEQLKILQKGCRSRFFPTVFDYDRYSIIMSFINGITLKDYLVKGRLDSALSMELVKLIEEFKKLRFTRLDIRLAHIFVLPDKSIKIIDPRGSFRIKQSYPLLMMQGLKEQGFLDEFLYYISTDYPDYYSFWRSKMYKD